MGVVTKDPRGCHEGSSGLSRRILGLSLSILGVGTKDPRGSHKGSLQLSQKILHFLYRLHRIRTKMVYRVRVDLITWFNLASLFQASSQGAASTGDLWWLEGSWVVCRPALRALRPDSPRPLLLSRGYLYVQHVVPRRPSEKIPELNSWSLFVVKLAFVDGRQAQGMGAALEEWSSRLWVAGAGFQSAVSVGSPVQSIDYICKDRRRVDELRGDICAIR
jgi:hypothetical protein